MPFIIDDKRRGRYLEGLRAKDTLLEVVLEARQRYGAQVELQKLLAANRGFLPDAIGRSKKWTGRNVLLDSRASKVLTYASKITCSSYKSIHDRLRKPLRILMFESPRDNRTSWGLSDISILSER